MQRTKYSADTSNHDTNQQDDMLNDTIATSKQASNVSDIIV